MLECDQTVDVYQEKLRTVGIRTGQDGSTAPSPQSRQVGDLVEQFIASLGAVLSQNHRMVWVGRDLIERVIPTALPQTGTPAPSPGCSELHPT